MKHLTSTVGIVTFLLIVRVGLSGQVAQNAEELARRHYELGLSFLQSQKYSEALKDFQTVVDSYPTSAVAGDALVELAHYEALPSASFRQAIMRPRCKTFSESGLGFPNLRRPPKRSDGTRSCIAYTFVLQCRQPMPIRVACWAPQARISRM